VARSLRQDDAAVIAALTTPWSTGQCEGQIRRVKLMNRSGYGSAKWDLLRQRILHRRGMLVRPGKLCCECHQPVAAYGGAAYDGDPLRSLVQRIRSGRPGCVKSADEPMYHRL
jgi:hypothetical protein